jgi:mRNA-degrading endonuclease RelE of RelBE toxin-antitoxin system
VTPNGREYVVLLSAEDLASLQATIELLADQASTRRVRRAGADVATGKVTGGDESRTPSWSPGARRALAETLPASAASATWEFISGPLVQNPRLVGPPLRAPFEGLWRARRGEYRVRYRIDDEKHQVTVLDIERRRDAYRS